MSTDDSVNAALYRVDREIHRRLRALLPFIREREEQALLEHDERAAEVMAERLRELCDL